MKAFLQSIVGGITLIAVIATGIGHAAPSTAFTYQGRLTDNDAPANGAFDFVFSLHDAANGGNAVGTPAHVATQIVENGVFTVALDFGGGVFTGDDRWVEIGVRTTGTGPYTTLDPRQQITAAPYALYALTPAGPTGATGATGPAGPTGATGPAGPAGIAGPTGTAGPVGPNGPPGLTWRGQWEGAANHNPNDAVHAQGSAWVALRANNNVSPAVGDDWSLLAAKGATGSTGPQGPPGPTGPQGPVGPSGAAATTANSLLISSDTDANEADSLLQLGVDNNAILTLRENGRVGIGREQPATALDVSGTVQATGFSGSGANLTGLNASQLSGTLASGLFGAGSIGGATLVPGSVNADRLTDGTVGIPQLATRIGGNSLEAVITNSMPANFEWFGSALATLGADKLLVGAVNADFGASDSGAVFVLNANGTMLLNITNPAPAQFDQFGFAIAALGSDKFLVSARFGDAGAIDAGAAYLFRDDGIQLASFTNPSPTGFDQFGSAVAAVGTNRALIGAPGDDTVAMEAGAAFLFDLNGNLLRTFTKPNPGSGDHFGDAVIGVGTDKVLIGASTTGAAYLFHLDGTLLTTYTNPAPTESSQFGWALAALDANTVVIAAGEGGSMPGATNGGVIHLYHMDGSLLRTIVSPTTSKGAGFGATVAAFGADKILVSATREQSGAVYVFARDGALLTTLRNPISSGLDEFGSALAVLGDDTAFVGAPQADTGLMDFGSVYRFRLSEGYLPGLVSEAVREGGVQSSHLATGSVTTAKLANSSIDSSKLVAGAITSTQLGNSSVHSSKLANGAVTTTKIADGTIAEADLSTSLANNTFWRRSGNSGVIDGTHFIGTTDNAPLELRVNNQRVFRYEADPATPSEWVNTLGGHSVNSIATGVKWATIAGGGWPTKANMVSGNLGSVGGGYGNTAGTSAVVGGGTDNLATGNSSTIGGGNSNHANDLYTTIGGGNSNQATDSFATVGGGTSNKALGARSTIGGGQGNQAGSEATIAGGTANVASGYRSAVGGGGSNEATATRATVGGGSSNQATNSHTTISGGLGNRAFGPYSTVPGGSFGKASNHGQMAYAAGRFSADGDAQTSVFVLRIEASSGSNTTVPLALDGSALDGIPIPDDSTWAFSALVVGRSSTAGSAAYRIEGVIRDHFGTTEFVGTPSVVILGESHSTYDATVEADNVNKQLVIKGSVSINQTMRWVASVRTVELIH